MTAIFTARLMRRALATLALATFYASIVAFAPTAVADERVAQGDVAEPADTEPQYKKTIIVEPTGDGQPTVTIFTDDRSIKDISEEAEVNTPSKISPYSVAPRKVQSLMESPTDKAEDKPKAPSAGDANAATNADGGAPNDSGAVAKTISEDSAADEVTTRKDGGLIEILGQPKGYGHWIITVPVAVLLIAILTAIIYKRRKKAYLFNEEE